MRTCTLSLLSPPQASVVKRLGNSVHGVILNVIAELGDREALAYRHLPSILGNIMPRCYASNVHWCGVGSIVLEDLGSLRSVKSIDSARASVADVAALLHSVGTLHGRTWNGCAVFRRFSVKKNTGLHAYFPSMLKKIQLSGLADVFSGPAMSEVLKQLLDFNEFQALLRKLRGRGVGDPLDKLPHTFVLCHRDPRFDNAFFRPGEFSAVLIDWQTITLAILPSTLVGCSLKPPLTCLSRACRHCWGLTLMLLMQLLAVKLLRDQTLSLNIYPWHL